MSVQIWVDNIEIELSDKPVSIPCTYQLLDVKDINKRKGSTTKTIQVPRTARNDKVFGFAFDINGRNAFDKYSEHRILIEEDTMPIFDGFLKLTNVSEEIIEFFCFKDISKLKSLFGEKTLQDLNLADLDHLYIAGTYDNPGIFDTWDGIYPDGVAADYVYPVIDYGGFREVSIPGTGEEPAINILQLYPMVFNRRLVLQTMLDNGYSLKTKFFDDPITAVTGIPFTNSEFIHSVVGGVAVNGFYGYNSAFQLADTVDGVYVLEADTETSDPLTQWDGNEYEAQFNQTTEYTLNLQVEFSASNINLGAPSYLYVQVDTGSGYSTIRTEPVLRPNSRNDLLLMVKGVVTLATTDKIRFVFEFKGGTTSLNIKAQAIQFDPSAGGKTIEVGEFVQIAPNLPKLKQADYITALYKMYNWIINVDDVKGEVEIETFDEFYFGGEQVDMSGYLTLNPKPSIQYLPLDYSRKYDFKYKHDESDYYLIRYNAAQGNGSYLFGDGQLYLDNRGEATLVGEVPFSPTVVEKSFRSPVITPSVWLEIPTMLNDAEPNIQNTAREARMLIYAGLQSVATLSAGTATEIYVEGIGAVTEIPFAYFQKKFYNDTALDSFVQNLSFSTPRGEGFTLANLVDDYYRNSIQSLSVSPQVVAYFNLNSRIVSELNFRNLWYVDYFKAVFRVNKIIDYLPNGKQPTKVELIKAGVYNPIVPQFEDYT